MVTIDLMKNLRIPSCVLEGDAFNVINLLHDEEELLSVTGPIIEDIRLSILKTNIVNVKWVSRGVNKIANELAFYAKSSHLMEFF